MEQKTTFEWIRQSIECGSGIRMLTLDEAVEAAWGQYNERFLRDSAVECRRLYHPPIDKCHRGLEAIRYHCVARLRMGHVRYGAHGLNPDYPCLEEACRRKQAYLISGNLEALIDALNFLGLEDHQSTYFAKRIDRKSLISFGAWLIEEFIEPQHKRSHFTPTDHP